MEDYDIVKADFDDLAELTESKWNHNNYYFQQLLKLIPKGTGTCLDIGCGKGQLSSLLAQKCKQVMAVDLSDKMIAKAKSLNSNKNIKFVCGNILDFTFENNSLSAIVTTATAHHLPYEWLLLFAKEKLNRGGKLIILDLFDAKSLSDHILWAAAVIPNFIMNVIKNGSIKGHDAHEDELWQKHIQHDTFMTLDQIKQIAQKHIPAARIKRKLFWRYLLIWQK